MIFVPSIMPQDIIIAIDGYSSCGKSTVAKGLARILKYNYIDTGAMYRSVTLYFLNHNIDIKNKKEVDAALSNIRISFQYNPSKEASDTYLNGIYVEDEIREMRVSSEVSKVSAVKEVRDFLSIQQRLIGEDKGVIMDGRDIGTTIFPNADLKLFMIASDDVRSERRFQEMVGKGNDISREAVLENLIERDRIDSTREYSPLRQAKDAIVVDNSNLSISDQLDLALELVEKVKSTLV